MVRSSLRRAPLLLLALLSLAAAAAPLACLGANASEDRQLDAMRKEITEVQSDGDKFEERLDKLGGDSATARTRGSKPALDTPPPPPVHAPGARGPIDTPELAVVHVQPEGGERVSADDGKPAPILSFTNANIGTALAAHPAAPGLRVTAHNDRDGGTR